MPTPLRTPELVAESIIIHIIVCISLFAVLTIKHRQPVQSTSFVCLFECYIYFLFIVNPSKKCAISDIFGPMRLTNTFTICSDGW